MENFLADQLGDPKSKLNKKIAVYTLGIVAFLSVFYFLFLSAPSNFPVGAIISVEQGSSLHNVSLKLKQQHIIRSRIVFEALVILFGREERIISTNYYFENSLPVYVVARRISKGEHKMAPVSITIPEGFDVNQIADVSALRLTNFNKVNFLLQTKNLEGYLFPDTYFFLTTDNEKDVIDSMLENFKKKIAPILPEITASGKTEKNIVIMASVIEREAKGDADRGMISGILWKRLSIGMPLQADAVPETYKTKGLPKNPISNPGMESIMAAIYPVKSAYLYYLHDKNGIIHFAKTFDEHRLNKKKYLR